MASVAAAKRRAENESYKIKYKELEELEKRTPHKAVASLLGVPTKNTLSTSKKTKTEYLNSTTAALFQSRVKPEKRNKAVHK